MFFLLGQKVGQIAVDYKYFGGSNVTNISKLYVYKAQPKTPQTRTYYSYSTGHHLFLQYKTDKGLPTYFKETTKASCAQSQISEMGLFRVRRILDFKVGICKLIQISERKKNVRGKKYHFPKETTDFLYFISVAFDLRKEFFRK